MSLSPSVMLQQFEFVRLMIKITSSFNFIWIRDNIVLFPSSSLLLLTFAVISLKSKTKTQAKQHRKRFTNELRRFKRLAAPTSYAYRFDGSMVYRVQQSPLQRTNNNCFHKLLHFTLTLTKDWNSSASSSNIYCIYIYISLVILLSHYSSFYYLPTAVHLFLSSVFHVKHPHFLFCNFAFNPNSRIPDHSRFLPFWLRMKSLHSTLQRAKGEGRGVHRPIGSQRCKK